MICAECGKLIQGKDIQGSLKHPYCSMCWQRIWDGDDEKYMRWLSQVHERSYYG